MGIYTPYQGQQNTGGIINRAIHLTRNLTDQNNEEDIVEYLKGVFYTNEDQPTLEESVL